MTVQPLVLRAAVVNWLLEFAGIDDLPLIASGADIGPIDRARYERRLDLLPGSLSIGRFPRDFPNMNVEIIGMHLLDESYLGTMQRSQERARPEPDLAPEPDSEPDLQTRYIEFLDAIGLESNEVLMLTGSPDVGRLFARWGAYTPELRRQPGHTDFSRYGLAIIGRGQAGHKLFEPWTQTIKAYDTHVGPTMLTSPSSNVSGMLTFLWEQRESIRRYVDEWRAVHG